MGECLNGHLMEMTFNQFNFIISFFYRLMCTHRFSQLRLLKVFSDRGKAEKTLDLIFHARDVSDSYINQFLEGVICCAIYRAGQKVITAWPAAETHLNAGWVNEKNQFHQISAAPFFSLCATCFCHCLWATDANSVRGSCDKTNHVDWKYI